MKKRMVVCVAVGAVLVGAGVVSFALIQRKSPPTQADVQPQLSTFHHDETGVSVDYAAELQVEALSDQDKKDLIVFRAAHPQGSTTPFLITLRYETGLRLPARAAKTDTIDLIVDGAAKALPSRFPAYHQVSERRMQHRDHEAAEIIFTYKGPSGERAKQRLLMVVKDDNTAFYLTGQTKEGDYDQIADKYFNQVFDSFRFE